MHEDRALLQMAAKAAGYIVWFESAGMGGRCMISYPGYSDDAASEWNPLNDDGQAFRLFVRLRMSVTVFDDAVGIGCKQLEDGEKFTEYPMTENDHAATRRAIVMAAAKIGERL